MNKQINQMEEEIHDEMFCRNDFMVDEELQICKDLFEEFLVEQSDKNSMEIETIKPIHHRSSSNLVRRSDFRKILNSSSSNERLIPFEINNVSSGQNSERENYKNQFENSFDSNSFRKSFKKKFQQSFSISHISHTIRDSSSELSERSDSKSSHNIIIPFVYKEEEMLEEKKVGCNCKRSRCLKLYCQCFQKQLFCNQNCNCHTCGNKSANSDQHKQAVIQALARNAYGFNEKEQGESNPQIKSFSLGVEPAEVRKGCKCKKTKCIKKYCECYQSGLQCGIFCKCEGCINTSAHKHEKKQFKQPYDIKDRNKKKEIHFAQH